jgi:hypothetical protein
MDDKGLGRSVGGLAPPDLDGARQRAKLVARARFSEAEAAKGTMATGHRKRGLVFAGALVAVAAGAVIAIGTGGKSGVRPEVASAAELAELGDSIPRLQLAGGWQIVNTESAPGQGSIQYRYEEAEEFLGVPPSGTSEIRWHTVALADRGKELESEGFTFAGQRPMEVSDNEAFEAGDFSHSALEQPAQVYIANQGADGSFDAAGLWEEGGLTLEYRSHVDGFYNLERLMERIELLTEKEWLIALQAGGGVWLSESLGGLVQKTEKVKIGENANGEPIYTETAIIGDAGAEAQEKTLEEGFPELIREGDTVRTVISKPSIGPGTP